MVILNKSRKRVPATLFCFLRDKFFLQGEVMTKENLFSKREVTQKILPVIENVCAKNGLIPVEVSLVKEAGRWFLRIFIFSHDHPITHKDCEKTTRDLDDYLDELIPVKYFIEISSPGAERKFKSSIEYTIFKGKKVKVVLKQPKDENDNKILYGNIMDYQKNVGLKLQLAESNQELLIEEDNIQTTSLCLE
jgi:ribosome maturation factor RimP